MVNVMNVICKKESRPILMVTDGYSNLVSLWQMNLADEEQHDR